jgi:hypothetical protein
MFLGNVVLYVLFILTAVRVSKPPNKRDSTFYVGVPHAMGKQQDVNVRVAGSHLGNGISCSHKPRYITVTKTCLVTEASRHNLGLVLKATTS